MAEASEIDPSEYRGADRYIQVAEDFLGVELTSAQRRIMRAVGEYQRVHVQSGNGVGKSFTAAVLNLAFLIRHPGSTNMATSGSYSVLSDVLWKPMRSLFRDTDLPGRALQSPPRIELDDDWYFKAMSPRYPGNLEGRHAGAMLVTIEEVDKPDISREHFDSAESMLTSDDDRILAISNPPEEETNVAYELAESDRWHTIKLSSFDSRNVRVDIGDTSANQLPGLVDLDTIREDWEQWNNEPWPGVESARTAHDRRDDLDTRWYRRRAGVVPPAGASVHRPFDRANVEAAWNRELSDPPREPSAVAIDVARSGDRTVMIGVHGNALRVHYAERGADHTQQETALRAIIDQWDEAPRIAIDAVGEGSGLADRLQQAYPRVERFKAGATASQDTEFRDCWAEGLHALGQWLDDGGAIADQHLREELLAAARTVEFSERHFASRGRDGATVLEATSKSALKEQLGRSPDALDAALMATWIDAGHATATRKITRIGPPGDRSRTVRKSAGSGDEPARIVRRGPRAGPSSHRSGRQTSDRERIKEVQKEKRRYWSDDR